MQGIKIRTIFRDEVNMGHHDEVFPLPHTTLRIRMEFGQAKALVILREGLTVKHSDERWKVHSPNTIETVVISEYTY